jgi:hypothetical protein
MIRADRRGRAGDLSGACAGLASVLGPVATVYRVGLKP